MDYAYAIEKVKQGSHARRENWVDNKIRMATYGDQDHINVSHLSGIIVSECPSRKCDCVVCIYNATEEDKQAQDWVVLN